jgi:adenosine kinase
MSVLISGSMAFDTVMVFPGLFKDHILPERVHMLSVSFFVPEMRRNFGGVAGNVAYNLHCLGVSAEIVAAVGDDFAPYQQWLNQHKISTASIKVMKGTYTAQAFITTDQADNQITAFHPGAMQLSGELPLPSGAFKVGLVGPDSKAAMQNRLKQLKAAHIPAIFDPGQGLPMFNGDELKQMIADAHMVIVNDYEANLLQERTGFSAKDIASLCHAYVVTRGAEGSNIYMGSDVHNIPVVPATEVVDPTGCGDAFRSGILAGVEYGWDLPTSARVGSLMGSLKIAHSGTQNHTITLATMAKAYQQVFGLTLPV